MSGQSARIAMVAGEASGDLLAAPLIKELKARRPELAFYGIGGPKMQALGFESYVPMDRLAVRGYFEALRHVREISAIRKNLAARLLADPPDAFIGIDAPDFNLSLEQRLKRAGIPTVHYVSPSIWAWRAWRIRKIARAVTHMLALFPIEAPLYERAGVPVTYVGHPLADVIPLEVSKEEARAQLRLPRAKRVVALLPGSRRSELQYMAELFVKTARRLQEEMEDIHFVCPMATRETRELFETALRHHAAGELSLTLLFGHSHEALAAADLALVASGTATLEAALFGTPMVITYRMSPLTAALMRRMQRLPYVGLPNVLAGEFLVPELLQEKATPSALSAELIALMRNTDAQKRQREKFHDIHLTLRQGATQKAADAVLAVLDRART